MFGYGRITWGTRYVRIRTNSIGQHSGYLPGYISHRSWIQIRRSSTIEMDELVVGYEFADFKSLSAAENSNFVKFYKRDRTVDEDVCWTLGYLSIFIRSNRFNKIATIAIWLIESPLPRKYVNDKCTLKYNNTCFVIDICRQNYIEWFLMK